MVLNNFFTQIENIKKGIFQVFGSTKNGGLDMTF